MLPSVPGTCPALAFLTAGMCPGSQVSPAPVIQPCYRFSNAPVVSKENKGENGKVLGNTGQCKEADNPHMTAGGKGEVGATKLVVWPMFLTTGRKSSNEQFFYECGGLTPPSDRDDLG